MAAIQMGRRTAHAAVAAVLPLVALLSGCADYHPAPISPAANASALQARRLDDPRLRAFLASTTPGDTKGTWGLLEVTLAALYWQPDLDVARASLAGAEAGTVTAGEVPNPSLSFEELSYNSTVATPSPWTVAPVVNFLIETFGKREHREEQARRLAAAARSDVAEAAWQVRARVRGAMLALWSAERHRTLDEQRLRLQNELVDLLEHRFAAGQASALDVTRERTRRNQVTLELRDIDRQAAEARAQLAIAIGVPLSALNGITLSFNAFDRPAPLSAAATDGEMRRQALEGRADVQSLLARYQAAEAALQLEMARQYPNITLSPGYAYDAGANKYMLLPAADLPIFNQNQGPIAEAEAHRTEAAAKFTALQAHIIGAVDGASASLLAADAAVATADALAADERQREAGIARTFAAGATDRPTLVTAQLERLAAEISRLDTEVAERQSLAALEDALQAPLFVAETAPPPNAVDLTR